MDDGPKGRSAGGGAGELIEEHASRTALRVALRRAAHQVYDARPLVFEDALAVRILGPEYAEELRKTATKLEKPFSVALRAFLVGRSRYAEDCLRAAYARGCRQYCLLGAGLDTFGYRNQLEGLRVFEVDHPATQAWKRGLLERSGIAVPDSVTLVPVDFERHTLLGRLEAVGFDAWAPVFCALLGVVPYLTLEAFRETLGFVGARAKGSGVVMDYGLPREALPFLEQLAHDSLASRVKRAGEPFQLFFRPEEMRAELETFSKVEDLGATELNGRYFEGRGDELRMRGTAARLVCAWI